MKAMMAGTDMELGISGQTGAHHVDMTKDILTLVDTLQEAELFKQQPGRVYAAFPGFRKNLLAKLEHKALWNWDDAQTQRMAQCPFVNLKNMPTLC